MDSVGFFERTEILPAEILLDRDLRSLGIGELADDGGEVEQGGSDRVELRKLQARGPDAALAGDELVARSQGTDEDGLDHPFGADRPREFDEVGILGNIGELEASGLIEAGSDVPQGDLLNLRIGRRWRQEGVAGNPKGVPRPWRSCEWTSEVSSVGRTGQSSAAIFAPTEYGPPPTR